VFSFDNLPDLKNRSARAEQTVRAALAWKRQDAGAMGKSTAQGAIRSVAIIGAGVMGAELAAAHIKHNLPVTVVDKDPRAFSTILSRTIAELAEEMADQDFRASAERLLCPAGELAEAGKCDLIIESINEKSSAKQKLFTELQGFLAPAAFLVSNTSTIPIAKLAETAPAPERFCGMHFFHPVRERPIVEIIRARQTSEETISAVVAHAKAIDKLPLVVADGPGFLVNRLLLPYLTEALELLAEGAALETIEQAALEFGMAKGPFCLMDEIGLDTALQAGWILAEAFPERIASSPLLVALIKSGRLGRKSRAGFFSYGEHSSAQRPLRPDPAAGEIIARCIKASRRHEPEEIALRLLLAMVLEAARIVEEGKVRDVRDIELGAIFGLGFPARRGGLLWWADTLGAAKIVEMLQPFESRGPRLQPTRYLFDLASKGGKFYRQIEAPMLPALPISFDMVSPPSQLIE
jgi:3-hydroxyacyl-CoA dehydrogenase